MDFEKVADDIVSEFTWDDRWTRNTMIEKIASALRTAAEVPEGHVMLPGGRVVKVLGTLPMTVDGCVVGMDAEVWLWQTRPHRTSASALLDVDTEGDIEKAKLPDGWGFDAGITPSRFYSTRKSALANKDNRG